MINGNLSAPAFVGELRDPQPVSVQVLREGAEVVVFVDQADESQRQVLQLHLTPQEARAVALWLVETARFAETNAET